MAARILARYLYVQIYNVRGDYFWTKMITTRSWFTFMTDILCDLFFWEQLASSCALPVSLVDSFNYLTLSSCIIAILSFSIMAKKASSMSKPSKKTMVCDSYLPITGNLTWIDIAYNASKGKARRSSNEEFASQKIRPECPWIIEHRISESNVLPLTSCYHVIQHRPT